jgi:hypothetical protein
VGINRSSGRVVIDLKPSLKLALHAALAAEGVTLKDWFAQRAADYLDERQQSRFVFGASRATTIEETDDRSRIESKSTR